MKQLLLFLSLLAGWAAIQAQPADTAAVLRKWELLPYGNLWLNTSNPASIALIHTNIAVVDISYRNVSGDYRNYSEPSKINLYKVESEGYFHTGKLSYYGKFNYDLARQKKMKWNDVLFISPDNPFVIADSIGGDYDTETFSICGGVAGDIPANLRWGLLADYQVGSSADQTDPRPQINATRFSLKPGLTWNRDCRSIGANLLVGGYKEDVSFLVVDNTLTNHYFLMMGLGNYYPNSGDSHTRSYSGKTIGGDIQAGYKKAALHSILQAGYKHVLEEAIDGSSTSRFRGGDYKSNVFSFVGILGMNGGTVSQVLRLNGSYSLVEGVWYDQKQVVNANNETYWQVYNKSVKYKSNLLEFKTEYSWIKDTTPFGYALKLSLDYKKSEIQCFPDDQFMKYSYVLPAISINAFLTRGATSFSILINAGYKVNLEKENRLNGIQLSRIISFCDYEYAVSNLFLGSAAVKVGKLLNTSKTEIYLKPEIFFCKAADRLKYIPGTFRAIKSIQIGYVF